MIKKVINFLDKHRLILVLLILFVISIIFISLKIVLFLNYNFDKLQCTEKLDNIYCYHDKIKIYIEPENIKKAFFEENKYIIKELKEKYNLPEFNKYTSYYYELIALLNYDITGTGKELYNFFEIYNNTYDIERFYQENNFYYEIFYQYKIF